jgi:hypothetical protein
VVAVVWCDGTRRWADERDPPLVIKGPKRVFDSTRANAAGLFAQSLGRPVFRAYTGTAPPLPHARPKAKSTTHNTRTTHNTQIHKHTA